jgi:uncharacterized MAPEG superfamily protein
MSTPVLALLGFAVWTLVLLFGSVGVYRWSRILSGRARLTDFPADAPEGADWYKRAMRAHANCVENLPVFAAIVVAIVATGVRSLELNVLAVIVLVARVCQSLVHVALPQTQGVIAVRFTFFLVQAVAMLAMALLVVTRSSP